MLEFVFQFKKLNIKGTTMEMNQLLQELESLVAAMEESLAIISGTIAESGDPELVLKNMLAGKGSIEAHYGQNDWRDKLLRSSLRIVALKARQKNSADPLLQDLIASVLESPIGQTKKH